MQGTWLRRAALTAIAAASLSLPMLAAAQTDQSAQQTKTVAAHSKKSAAKAQRTQSAAQQSYGSEGWVTARCTWPYQNQFPPCQSTWPAGDPNYHGSRPGPTFDAPF